MKTYDNALKAYHVKEQIALFRRKDTESAVNSIYRLMNLVDKAFSNHHDPKNETNLRVIRISTLDEKLSKICKSNEMYQAVNKKLDLIRQDNKKPGITDYVHICQVEEESYERSQIAKLSTEVNQIQVEEDSNEEDCEVNVIERDFNYDRNQRPNFRSNEGYNEDTFETEQDDVEWVNHASNHDFNEYQNEDFSHDRNYHPWDDEEYDQKENTIDTFGDQNQRNYSRNEPKYRYHQVSQSVKFPNENKTPCHNCKGDGYISPIENECNEMQVLAGRTKQIPVPFDEDNDEKPEESM